MDERRARVVAHGERVELHAGLERDRHATAFDDEPDRVGGAEHAGPCAGEPAIAKVAGQQAPGRHDALGGDRHAEPREALDVGRRRARGIVGHDRERRVAPRELAE